MRFILTFLFLAMLVLGVWTFMDAHNHGWWLPPNVSSYGGDIDRLFYLILWMVGLPPRRCPFRRSAACHRLCHPT